MRYRHFLLIAASVLALTTGADAHRHEGGFYPHRGAGLRPWGFPPPIYRPAPVVPYYPPAPAYVPPPAYAPAPGWIPPRAVAPVMEPPVVQAVPVAPMAPAISPPVFVPAAPILPPASFAPSQTAGRDIAPGGTSYSETREAEHDGSWPGWLRMTVPAALVGGVGWYGLRRTKKHAGGKPQDDFAELPY